VLNGLNPLYSKRKGQVVQAILGEEEGDSLLDEGDEVWMSREVGGV